MMRISKYRYCALIEIDYCVIQWEDITILQWEDINDTSIAGSLSIKLSINCWTKEPRLNDNYNK